MFQETRLRLAVWYTLVTAVVLLLFGTGVYLYVRGTLVERIDDTLTHVVEIVERSLVIEEVPTTEGTYRVNIEASFRNNGFGVDDDHIDLEWFNPSGELVWFTFAESLNIPIAANHTGKTVHVTPDYLLRQVTERVQIGRYVLGYLRVSHPWFEVTKPSRQLIIDLTIGISLMIACVASIGWFLSGIAIKPVQKSYQSLKQFTADASHELRNPLAMIQINVQTALAYPDAEPQLLQRQLKLVERLTQRLGRLVNDLLFLARSDSGIVEITYQPVNLDALLIEVIEEQRTTAEKKGLFLCLHIPELVAENQSDPFTIMGDWDQLARLFTNLISNALEHTSSDKLPASVEVELTEIKRDRTLRDRTFSGPFPDRHRHTLLQVKVTDTGKGIPEANLPHIFDRFYRVDPSRSHVNEVTSTSGAGLGLAIAAKIVTNHQGNISVESVVNQGTTFTITFPKATS